MAKVTSFTISKSSVSSFNFNAVIPHETEFHPGEDYFDCYMCGSFAFAVGRSLNGIHKAYLRHVGDTAFIIVHDVCEKAFEIQLVAPEID